MLSFVALYENGFLSSELTTLSVNLEKSLTMICLIISVSAMIRDGTLHM